MLIEPVTQYSPDLLEAVNGLLPQLDAGAKGLGEEQLRAIIESEVSHLLIARENDRIFGMLTLVVYKIPSGVKAWIEDVVVSEDARGKGVGTQLMQRAIELAKSLGAKSLDLTSRPEREAANRLYQRLGFQLRQTNVYRLQLPER
jgi:ribosomal protein S18 acetylase RimI-like enzyme